MRSPTEKMLRTVEFINNRFALKFTKEMQEDWKNIDLKDFNSVSNYIAKYFEKAKAIKPEPRRRYKEPTYNQDSLDFEKYGANFEMGYGYDD